MPSPVAPAAAHPASVVGAPADGRPTGPRRAQPRPATWAGWYADALLLVLVVGVAGWLRWAFVQTGAPLFVTPDSDDYLRPAYDLAHGLGFDPELRRTPLYPAFIAVVLVAGGNLAVLAVAQHVLGMATAALTYGLGRATFGRLAGLLAGLATGLSGPLLIHEHSLMAEALFTLLLTAALLLLVLAVRGAGWSWPLAAGAVTGLAALTRPIGQAAIPIAVLAALASAAFRADRGLVPPRSSAGGRGSRLPGVLDWKAPAFLLLGLGVILLPWMARNWVVHGTFGAEGALGQALIGRTLRHDKGFVYDDPSRPDPDPVRARARQILQQEADAGEPSGGTITQRIRDELGLSQAQTSALLRDLALDAIGQRPGYYLAGTAETAWELFQGKNERLLGHWRQRTTRNWDRRWDARLVPLLEPELPAEGPAYTRADALTSLFQPWRWRTPIAWLFGAGVVAALLVPRWRSGLLPAATALALVVAAAALDGLVWRFRYPADPLIAVVASGGLAAPLGLIQRSVLGVRRGLRQRRPR